MRTASGHRVNGAAEDGEALFELVVGDVEGHEGADAVAVLAGGQEEEALLQGGLDDLGVALLVRRLALGVGDELHGGHRAEAPDVADEVGVLLLDLAHGAHELLAQGLTLGDEVFLLEGVEDGQRRGARYGVAAVGGTEASGVDGVHNLRLPGDAGYGEPPAHALGRDHDVGLDSRVLYGEHLARPPVTGLDLVHDQDDPVLVAQLPQLPEVEIREGYEPALAAYRLDDDRRHTARVHGAYERLLYGREAIPLAAAGAVPAGLTPVRVGRRYPVDLGDERPEALLVPVGLARERHREHGAAVEGVLEGYDRGAARIVARDLDGVLHRLRPGVDEEGPLLRGARHYGVEPLGELYVLLVLRDVEAGVGHLLGLLLDRLDHPPVGVPDVHHTDAAAEVYERVAVHVGQQGALRFLGEHRGGDADARSHRLVPPLHQRPALRPRYLRLDPRGIEHPRHLFLSA